jgi:CDP-diglyceride synthetase
MNSVIKASVALAVLVTIISVIFTAAGLHKSAIIFAMPLVFVVLNLGCIFWALSSNAAANGYGKQLLNAAVFGVIAGVLIFGSSMLQSKVIFPDSTEETKTAMIEFLEDRGLPEEQLQDQVDKIEASTPEKGALQGLIGTFLTSLVVGAIVAIFKRKKS